MDPNHWSLNKEGKVKVRLGKVNVIIHLPERSSLTDDRVVCNKCQMYDGTREQRSSHLTNNSPYWPGSRTFALRKRKIWNKKLSSLDAALRAKIRGLPACLSVSRRVRACIAVGVLCPILSTAAIDPTPSLPPNVAIINET
jgi:hypothetical protein